MAIISFITFYRKFSLTFGLNIRFIIYIHLEVNDKYYTFPMISRTVTEIVLLRLMHAKELVDSFMAKEEDTPSSPLME